jgi:hypothetical protein
MIKALRTAYNEAFSDSQYLKMLAELSNQAPTTLGFRVAETPIFIDAATKKALLTAGDEINAFITSAAFEEKTRNSFFSIATPPNEGPLPECIVMDFALCNNNKNEIVPKLIELQGFPSLFGFEVMHDIAFRNNFDIPNGFSPYLNQYTQESYLAHLRQIIKGDQEKHTVLLELFPEQQKTKIDFEITQQLIDIPVVCVTELMKEDHYLYYIRDHKKYRIERIYNRVVWDELEKQSSEVKEKAALLSTNVSLEWVTHPNHYYRISKYILPFLSSSFVPKTAFLSTLKTIPDNLNDYVVKPLFSYAGQGVKIDVTKSDIELIKDPQNWIIQEKVEYAPIIETPSGPAKTEIRLFYFWDHKAQKYIATLNLARLSKGKMIGVNYNANATWVGGSIAYFEMEE